jgi:hypothetical protein
LRLGDFFPNEDKLTTFRDSLRVGTVYYLYTSFIAREKDKFFLIVCTDPLLLFFISTCPIHPILANNKDLKKCQVIIEEDSYPFLPKKSYINCTEVVNRFTTEDAETQILADMSRIKGQLSKDHLKAVRLAVEKDIRTPLRTKLKLIPAIDQALSEY